MKKALGFIIAIGVYLAWQFFGTSLVISGQNAAGMGWNDAKPELTKIHTTQLKVLLKENRFELSSAVQAQLTTCLVDDSVVALNKTGCSYQYNKATTTEAEHTAKQDACLEAKGWAKQEEGIFVRCVQAHFPNDWAVVSGSLGHGMKQAMLEAGRPVAEADKIARCVAPKFVALLKGAGCHLINKEAKGGAGLFGTVDECVTQHDLAPKLLEITDACAPQAAP